MKLLILFLILFASGCSHFQMNDKRAKKLCRKVFGPKEDYPKELIQTSKLMKKEIEKMVVDCYLEHTNRTKDPRDYVSCAVATYAPSTTPTLKILSSPDFQPPEIMIQCVQEKFKKFKKHPRVNKLIRIEVPKHLITVIKV